MRKVSLKTTECDSIVGVMPKEGLAGLVAPKFAFGMIMAKILGPIFALYGSHETLHSDRGEINTRQNLFYVKPLSSSSGTHGVPLLYMTQVKSPRSVSSVISRCDLHFRERPIIRTDLQSSPTHPPLNPNIHDNPNILFPKTYYWTLPYIT